MSAAPATLGAMSTVTVALATQRALAESAALRLLRAQNAPAIAALLQAHLGGTDKRVAAPVLFENMDADLDDLRDRGFELPLTARGYCAEWVRAGFLVRRAAEEAREETYELSDGALTAIRFLEQVTAPRTVVTESRLATILRQLRELAVETDPDATSRLAALTEQRARLDEQIARVSAGEIAILPDERAAERAEDILGIAAELPADFARVRAELEELNRALRERLIQEPEARGTVLDEVFRGMDHLADSEAGRSFNGFYALILDSEQASQVDGDVAALLQRDFTAALTRPQVRQLRRLIPSLQDQSTEIHDVMTSFTRSLRRFVQSHEFQEDRQLNASVREVMGTMLTLADRLSPLTRLDRTLDLTSVPLTSIAALRLHNPADSETQADVTTAVPDAVDIADIRALARESDIDMAELRRNVSEVVSEIGAATIGDVLDRRPATQGLASVVGLLILAEEHASALGTSETVRWVSRSGATQLGTVPHHLFKEPIE